jgi:hypothetical protein
MRKRLQGSKAKRLIGKGGWIGDNGSRFGRGRLKIRRKKRE